MTAIVATSPGDIIVEFTAKVGSNMKSYSIPIKNISANKSMEVSKEYGIGSHQAYAEVVGKIGYEGDFTVGSWYVTAEENPTTWNYLIRNFLTFQNDEGLPKEFTIKIMARYGSSMVRTGTGTYGSGDDGESDVDNYATIASGAANQATQQLGNDNLVIETYNRCILKGDGVDIPEVGGVVSKKYPFSCLSRDPK